MPRAQYTAEGGTYRIDGQSFEPGDEREVSREVANHLADVEDFEVIVEKDDPAPQEEDKPPDPEDPDVESGSLPFNPESHTVSEIEDRVAEIDDEGALRALRNHEEEQQDRTTAVEAIEARLAELEG